LHFVGEVKMSTFVYMKTRRPVPQANPSRAHFKVQPVSVL